MVLVILIPALEITGPPPSPNRPISADPITLQFNLWQHIGTKTSADLKFCRRFCTNALH